MHFILIELEQYIAYFKLKMGKYTLVWLLPKMSLHYFGHNSLILTGWLQECRKYIFVYKNNLTSQI